MWPGQAATDVNDEKPIELERRQIENHGTNEEDFIA